VATSTTATPLDHGSRKRSGKLTHVLEILESLVLLTHS